MSLSTPTRTIDRASSEDDMVATLLGLKASQLAGMIEPQRFRVESLHVMWCAQRAGHDEAVARRVREALP